MQLKFVDRPTLIGLEEYNILTDKVVKLLLQKESVQSIYRMGSIKNPGISDLDIICVFKDNSDCHIDIHTQLNPSEKRILTHGCFGIEKSKLEKSIPYNYLTNLILLGGEDLDPSPILEIDAEVKKQIALEYLLKMHITLDIQITYGIVKLRSFLLQAKAIIFDLDLMSIQGGKLRGIVNEVINIRDDWFNKKFDDSYLNSLIRSFHKELHLFLKQELRENSFFLPRANLKITRNIYLNRSETFKRKHTGISLPPFLNFLGKKYVNVQNRINKFTYHVPLSIPSKGSKLSDRFEFYKDVVQINKSRFPHFIPLTTSLPIFR